MVWGYTIVSFFVASASRSRPIGCLAISSPRMCAISRASKATSRPDCVTGTNNPLNKGAAMAPKPASQIFRIFADERAGVLADGDGCFIDGERGGALREEPQVRRGRDQDSRRAEADTGDAEHGAA